MQAGQLFGDIATVREEGDFLGEAFVVRVQRNAHVGKPFKKHFPLPFRAGWRVLRDRLCEGEELSEAGEKIFLQVFPLGGAHRVQVRHRLLQGGRYRFPCFLRIDGFRLADFKDARLADEIGGGRQQGAADDEREIGESGFEGSCECGIDADLA